MVQNEQNCWDQYWEQGAITSFGSAIDNYQGALLNIWQAVANSFVGEVNVLDIGTGNGAIPLLLDKYSAKSATGAIIGVDKANVKDCIVGNTLDISLRSGIDVAALPYDKEHFHYVVSQFGFEYGLSPLAIDEVLRVMKTNAKLVLVMHNKDSFIVQQNSQELKFLTSPQLERVTQELKHFVEQMGYLASAEAIRQAQRDERLEGLRKAFFAELKMLWELDNESYKNAGISNAVDYLFKTGISWTVAQKLDFIDQVFGELNAHKQRLAQLVNAALDEQEVLALLEQLCLGGCNIELIKVVKESDGRVLAWQLVALKYAAS
ncbi:hypothetical protein HR45_05925 [Shewanella mangrovi]|uniref:Methyltransferase domain-containing protein n=1 Tax=Shewanella mangrovi TaxID=1515746 RepID=A0A094K060_9GAMM|nr:class I SAM-dependent methyltransferase [Shewanella mangrovi]KFZ38046.1 hypothetical protein HR45_05925 [Shewanella mangrovi]